MPQAADTQQSSSGCLLRQESGLYVLERFSTESETVQQKIQLTVAAQWNFYVNTSLPNFPEASLPFKLFLFLHCGIVSLR